MYEPVKDFRTHAEAYLINYPDLVSYIVPMTPPARVFLHGNSLTFKFTPIGENYIHHVYVEIKAINDDTLLAICTPKYPMYLLGSILPFLPFYYPSALVRQENDVRIVLCESIDTAVDVTAELFKNNLHNVVSLSQFKPPRKASFEGLLHRINDLYISYLEKKPAEVIDIITGHREEQLLKTEKEPPNNIKYPHEVIRDFINMLLKHATGIHP